MNKRSSLKIEVIGDQNLKKVIKTSLFLNNQEIKGVFLETTEFLQWLDKNLKANRMGIAVLGRIKVDCPQNEGSLSCRAANIIAKTIQYFNT
ncbi:hypothetical protein C4553_01525 [Candidatus Parcubacteria bacterium]|nr:MAG: hypothetical protein C4553_01525 [Candidatus Parcubacteria bacterium]